MASGNFRDRYPNLASLHGENGRTILISALFKGGGRNATDPTLFLRMWSSKGQQVMICTPGQPKKHYGIGVVNYHTGGTVVLIRKRKRRPEMAKLLQTLLDKHSTGTIYLAWDNVWSNRMLSARYGQPRPPEMASRRELW